MSLGPQFWFWFEIRKEAEFPCHIRNVAGPRRSQLQGSFLNLIILVLIIFWFSFSGINGKPHSFAFFGILHRQKSFDHFDVILHVLAPVPQILHSHVGSNDLIKDDVQDFFQFQLRLSLARRICSRHDSQSLSKSKS